MNVLVFDKDFSDSCFLHNDGYIYEGTNFLPRKTTIVSNAIDVLTLDAENYLTIFHPGSVKLVQTLKGIRDPSSTTDISLTSTISRANNANNSTVTVVRSRTSTQSPDEK